MFYGTKIGNFDKNDKCNGKFSLKNFFVCEENAIFEDKTSHFGVF